jgi:hypothetical protein
VESSLLVLADFLPDSPLYYQFNFGYMKTKKDVIIAEAITWIYSEPLGTYTKSKELYPGKVRAYGTDNKKIQEGFQLYIQFILGYRFEFFKKRLFVEPAYAIKYWPVNTNFPESFAAIEGGTP